MSMDILSDSCINCVTDVEKWELVPFEFCLDLLTPLTPHEYSYTVSGMTGEAGSLS